MLVVLLSPNALLSEHEEKLDVLDELELERSAPQHCSGELDLVSPMSRGESVESVRPLGSPFLCLIEKQGNLTISTLRVREGGTVQQ